MMYLPPVVSVVQNIALLDILCVGEMKKCGSVMGNERIREYRQASAASCSILSHGSPHIFITITQGNPNG